MTSKFKGFSSSTLHIIGMLLMLCDHIGCVFFPQYQIFRRIGRLAFPIFAFTVVEGFLHTKNIKQYILRIVIFAVLSEIPFDLMLSGQCFDFSHQNVLWTFALGLLMLHCMNKTLNRCIDVGYDISVRIGSFFILFIVFAIAALLMETDYSIYGIAMIFVFYIFHGQQWYCKLGQFLCLLLINCCWMNDLNLYAFAMTIVQIFTQFKMPPTQCFAMFVFLFVWNYNGEKGISKTWFKHLCYLFYPLHALLLYGITCVV